jgi:hypothetical protein
MYQGYNRVVKAMLYMRFLLQYYVPNTAIGNSLRRNQYLQVLKDNGHDVRTMVSSDPVTYATFGNLTTSVCNVCGSSIAVMTKPRNYVIVTVCDSKTQIKCLDLYLAGKSSLYTSDVCLSLLLQISRLSRFGK